MVIGDEVSIEEGKGEEIRIKIPEPHEGGQGEYVKCGAKRQVIKSGRQFGKTFGAAIKASCAFLGICNECLGEGCLTCDNTGRVEPKRVLYAAPTAEQVGKFWYEVCKVLSPGIDAGIWKKDETEHIIEVPRTEIRIKGKTAWNANTLRGDWADLLILEEYQLMNEDAWEEVGQPMLLRNNGTAVFIFTPPSLRNQGISKAKDPRHASKMYRKYVNTTNTRWECFHFTSYDNPTLNKDALAEISGDMNDESYRREILAEDDEIETSWLVYSKFSESLCKIKRFAIPLTWPVFSGHDFGQANPAALFMAQVKLPVPDDAPSSLRYGDYIAFHEYSPGAGFSSLQHIDEFRRVTSGRDLSLSVGGNVTTEEEIRQLYTRDGWGIHAPFITRVNGQIERVIRIMESKRLYIFDDLYRLLGQIANCMWVLDNENKPTNKVRDEAKYHLLACLRYVCTILSVESVLGKRPISTGTPAV